MKHVYALIMAGGKGQRIWPASRLKNPKYLLALWGKKTMLEQTLERISPQISPRNTFIVTNQRYKETVRKQIPHPARKNLILEPFGKNTAACIGLGALWLQKQDPDAIMVILPSDHVIKNRKTFLRALSCAAALAKSEDALVTLGILPRFPATGFGYVKLGKNYKRNKGIDIYKAARFVEKPDLRTARRYVRSCEYLWNGGIFVWSAKSILRSIERCMPKLHRGLSKISRAMGTRRYRQVLEKEYAKFEDVSIDNGVLERSPNVFAVFAALEWDDIGSWSSLDYLELPDGDRNVVLAEHFGIDTKDSILISEKNHLLATVGLSGLIIVQTKDATLVCRKERAQEVKELVKRLHSSRRFRKYT